MSLLNLENNPKWLAAVATERAIRESGFLARPTIIADGALSILPLTLRQAMVLFEMQSPIIHNGDATPADAAAFLWAVQSDYAPSNATGRAAFLARLHALAVPWRQVIHELRTFYTEQTLDNPKGGGVRVNKSGDAEAPAACGAAFYVHLYAKEYGWTYNAILDMPIICLNQLRRCINMQTPKHGITGGKLSNAAEKVAVLERQRKRKAEAPKSS